MRINTLVLAGAVLFAVPALAQSPSGNVAQPSRDVPQAGNTTGGPIDNPSTRGAASATGTAIAPAGTGSVSPSTGAAQSAKGGNADQTNKGTANTGGTAGGPAR